MQLTGSSRRLAGSQGYECGAGGVASIPALDTVGWAAGAEARLSSTVCQYRIVGKALSVKLRDTLLFYKGMPFTIIK